MTEKITPIPSRLKNMAVGGHVAGADDIIDDSLGKEQSQINQEVVDIEGRLRSVEEHTEIMTSGGNIVIANSADSIVEGSGSIPTANAVAARLRTGLATKQDVIGDLAEIRSKASTAYQKPVTGIPATDLASAVQAAIVKAGTALQPADISELEAKVSGLSALVDSDSDSVINKFNEIVSFLSGIADTETLAGILQDISTQLGKKYVKPQGGIPSSDMSEAVRESLDNADTAVQYDEALSPGSQELMNEYERVLGVLYQALTDAQVVTTDTNTARSGAIEARDAASSAAAIANEKAGLAGTAASAAEKAAALASEKASLADTDARAARSAAETARTEAQAAYGAAQAANAAMDAARGDHDSLSDRLEDISHTLDGKQAAINDLQDIRDGAGKGSTAVQPEDIDGLIAYEANNDPTSLI